MEPLPAKFIERIQQQFPNEWENLVSALNSKPPVSIRINKRKLQNFPGKYKKVPWSYSGIYLPERPVFTLDPLFHSGVYYPQEAASMVIEYIASNLKNSFTEPPHYILDAAAAPGGKTLILSDIFNESIVFANEIVTKRAEILTDNVARWGAENIIVTNNDTQDFQKYKGLFDVILLDAPCSGEGMFRKDLNARKEWSEENAFNCVVRQEEILHNILPLLKSGGYLIYSTCTFNPDENEQLMQKMFNNDFRFISMDELIKFGITKVENGLGYQFLPHKTQSEGFFVSVWKNNNQSSSGIKPKKKKKTTVEKNTNLPFSLPGNKKIITLHNDTLFAVPDSLDEHLLKTINVKYAGIKLGKQIKNKFKPAAEVALSRTLKNIYPHINLNYQNTLQYLKGNTNFTLPSGNSKGYYIITYHNHPVGLIHHLGNRFNNLHPKPWRIKMNIPENQQEILLF